MGTPRGRAAGHRVCSFTAPWPQPGDAILTAWNLRGIRRLHAGETRDAVLIRAGPAGGPAAV